MFFVAAALFSACLLPLMGCGSSNPTSSSFSLSAASYDFGVTLVGTLSAQTVAVLHNTGNLALVLRPTISGGKDFTLESGGCGPTLAPGESCNVDVAYAPPAGSSPAPESATVDIGIVGLSPAVPETVQVTGTPGVPAVSLSPSTYGFGDALVGGSQTQTTSVVTNTGNVALTLAPTLSGNSSFVLGSGGCSGALAVGATCDVVVTYAPTVASFPAQQTATVNLGLAPALAGTGETVTVTGTSGSITGAVTQRGRPAERSVPRTGTSGSITGAVTTTANTMVAEYTLTMPFAGTWNVSFGQSTTYGYTTSTVTTTGGATSVFVAGMLPNTTYHMRANVTLTDGQTAVDVDHTFASGALPAGIPASFPVTTGTGTPQPGIELMDPIVGSIPTSLIATDLQGNTIWAYKPTISGTPFVYPAKLEANGNIMMYIAPNSYPVGPTGTDVLREIDLAGDTLRELSMATLNTEMAAAGYGITLDYFTHDFVPLPNGHILVMANTTESLTGLTGYSGTENVVGDVVIDLNQNLEPDWVWNEFDHFDVNRHPWASQFPDWTHSNSLTYSAQDGNFIVSMRHQNWVAKVDFNNGAGSGDVLWTLGYQGNYSLVGGTSPTDWFYAQHDVEYATADETGVTTQSGTGIYSLTIMDNGDDRIYPNGGQCGNTGEPACYTTIMELQLNDSASTATIQFNYQLPTSLYNVYGGNVEILANGDVEYDLAGLFSTGSQTFEVTPGSNPQTVWHMTTPGSLGYRTFRLPSLYPGVQWP